MFCLFVGIKYGKKNLAVIVILTYKDAYPVLLKVKLFMQVHLVTLIVVLLTCMLSFISCATGVTKVSLASTTIFNVMAYGAKGNGKTDDSPVIKLLI